jgi:hypothetical protein
MLTIKSDDVYGRSKAYEAIIKGTDIVGPKVPESFNVLVKELQGLGLKVDLLDQRGVEADAESLLSSTIKDEAEHMPELDAPAEAAPLDITEENIADDFEIVEVSEDEPADVAITETEEVA